MRQFQVGAELAGQRLDNFLIKNLKGLPKSRLYRAIRQGEVRVNGRRVEAAYRLCAEDEIKVPPLRLATIEPTRRPREELVTWLKSRLLYQDTNFLVLDKPSGMPVHGGSVTSAGVIELLRLMDPKWAGLELVHRLDRDTSGCLLIAKRRRFLLEMQAQWSDVSVQKHYVALVAGSFSQSALTITAPLRKITLADGGRLVRVDPQGKPACTVVRLLQRRGAVSLVEAQLKTGRTHQIRVHLAHQGHPVVGDTRYGDFELNRRFQKQHEKRLMLHAARLSFVWEGQKYQFEAPLPPVFEG